MTIGTAIQKGTLVVVYDLRGRQLYSRVGELYGVTNLAVVIREDRGRLFTLYDEQGHRLASVAGTGNHGGGHAVYSA